MKDFDGNILIVGGSKNNHIITTWENIKDYTVENPKVTDIIA